MLIPWFFVRFGTEKTSISCACPSYNDDMVLRMKQTMASQTYNTAVWRKADRDEEWSKLWLHKQTTLLYEGRQTGMKNEANYGFTNRQHCCMKEGRQGWRMKQTMASQTDNTAVWRKADRDEEWSKLWLHKQTTLLYEGRQTGMKNEANYGFTNRQHCCMKEGRQGWRMKQTMASQTDNTAVWRKADRDEEWSKLWLHKQTTLLYEGRQTGMKNLWLHKQTTLLYEGRQTGMKNEGCSRKTNYLKPVHISHGKRLMTIDHHHPFPVVYWQVTVSFITYLHKQFSNWSWFFFLQWIFISSKLSPAI